MKRIGALGLAGSGNWSGLSTGIYACACKHVISVPSEPALAGSTGNSFDVTLTNTGPATVAIAGFGFQLLATNTGITFTGTSFSTVAPYIFAGVSFDQDFGFSLDTLSGGQELDASDVSDVPNVNVGAGSTVALGSVLFDVARQRGAGTSAGDAPWFSSYQPR
jgi:hypothetical protein